MRGQLGRLAVAVTVVLVLGAVAGLVAAGWWWPAPATVAAPATQVAVGASPVELVCPGPPRLAAQDAGLDAEIDVDPEFDPMPEGVDASATTLAIARAETGAPTTTWRPGLGRADDGAADNGADLAPVGATSASLVLSGLDGPGILVAEPDGGVAALVAGASLARTDQGDLRGLAAARCSRASASAWLLAGSTELGSSARLVLDNPGDTPATVTLELWGATGPVDAGQAGTVLVPAHAGRAVLLESLATEEARLAIHLTVDGGIVTPVLQDARLRGFVPAGVDLAEPVVEPAERVVVPGVVLVDTEIDDPEPSLLRVVNPGDQAATVALRLFGTDGPLTVPGAEERVIDPGTVADISLAGVTAGAYAAELVSDRPVTASAMLTRVGEPSEDDPDQDVVDRAWVGASPVSSSAVFTLPSLGDAVDDADVVLSNPGPEPVTIRARAVLPDGEVGEPFEVTVRGETTTVLDRGRLSGALAVQVTVTAARVDEGETPTGPGAGALPPAPEGVVGAVLLQAEPPSGRLIAAVGAQPDLEQARTVAVRLPNR